MKSDTAILNEISQKSPYLHRLTDEESAKLKELLLKMYQAIAKVCVANNLIFMLGGGSCLGAVRHQGFIPWDDDLDLMMPRDDYEKLIELCKDGALGEKYEINTPSKDQDCKNGYLKIYYKGTLDNELYNENTPFPKGVFIDVFPMETAPQNSLIRRFKGFVSDTMQFITTSVLYAQYPSKKYKEFISMDPDSKKRYDFRVTIGNFLKIIPHQKWIYWFDQFNSASKPTGLMTIPTGRNHYIGEVQPTDVFLPVKFMKFEGIDCPVPADTHRYLSSLYGDYMKMPPEEKRERHFVYEFKCDVEE